MGTGRTIKLIARLIAAGLLFGQAGIAPAAEDAPAPVEASIAAANRGGIRDWVVVDDSTLLIQDKHKQWYKARLQAPSYYLAYAENLRFTTGPSGALDKTGSIVVRGQPFPIVSLVASEGPPKKPKR